MSSTLDPSKLKVVELRSELAARELDTKGNKAVLVKRLQEALDAEAAEEGGNTSVAKADTSQAEESDSEPAEEPEAQPEQPKDAKPEVEEKMEAEEEKVEAKEEQAEPEPASEPEVKEEETAPVEENGVKMEEDLDKSAEAAEETAEKNTPEEEAEKDAPAEEASPEKKPEESDSRRGEKRRRSSPSPERPHQRKRSKSPIKEDEPILDNDKVQLSWYDSDLHLQVDKESFLSAKPLNEGAFGFVWAGVRTNYGVSSGKVCYEVKITEELKWEDFTYHKDRARGRDYLKSDHRKSTSPKKGPKESEKKTEKVETEDKESATNGDVKKEEQLEKIEEEATDAEAKSAEKEEKEEVKEEEAEEAAPAEKEDKETAEEADKPSEETPKEAESAAEEKKEEEEPKEPISVHVVRIGWSLATSDLFLGESENSFGYESSGKFVNNKESQEYGIKFAVGDVVGAYLSIDENVELTFTVNGVAQPTAVLIPRADLPEDFVLFPHIATRNVAFELNVGQLEAPHFAAPAGLESYVFLADKEDKVAGPLRPVERSECEVILMCGLPACGKTHWVREHVASNLDKKYVVIGNTQMLDKMTVSGKSFKSSFKGRWSILMDRLQKSINKLLELAPQRRRNYIIDQTNVFLSARRRKLRPFEGFKRKAVVLIISDEDQTKRQLQQQEVQDGKEVPENTIFEMKATMTLPEKGEWLDEVIFADLDEEKSKEMVEKYNKDAKAAGYGAGSKRLPRRNWNNRNDVRGRHVHDSRGYNRYDSRTPQRPSWNHRSSGNWERDRRDTGRRSMGGGRDWRPRDARPYDHRDHRHSSGGGGSYRRQSYDGRSSGGSRGGWQGYHHHQHGGSSGGGWNQQTFGHHHGGGGSGSSHQSSWGGQSAAAAQGQNQGWNWKYSGQGQGQSQGYGGYGSGNWNYYGQYAQGWGGQTQGTSAVQGQQQNWAQYAQQYAQQNAQYKK